MILVCVRMDEFIGRIRCWKRCLDLMVSHSKMEVCNDLVS